MQTAFEGRSQLADEVRWAQSRGRRPAWGALRKRKQTDDSTHVGPGRAGRDPSYRRRGRHRRAAPALPRHGRDPRRGHHLRQVRAHGRPHGVHPARLPAHASRGRRRGDRRLAPARAGGPRARGRARGRDGAPPRPRRDGRHRRDRRAHARPLRPHPGGPDAHLRAGGQPELRQDHALQPAYGRQPARGQLPRRHGGPQERPDQGPPRHRRDRPPGHLLALALQPRGAREPPPHPRRAPERHHQHRRRDQHRAQPLPHHAAHGTRLPHGARPQHDGRGPGQRRHHRRQRARGRPRHPRRAHLRAQELRRLRARRARPSRRALPRAPGPPGLLRPHRP